MSSLCRNFFLCKLSQLLPAVLWQVKVKVYPQHVTLQPQLKLLYLFFQILLLLFRQGCILLL